MLHKQREAAGGLAFGGAFFVTKKQSCAPGRRKKYLRRN